MKNKIKLIILITLIISLLIFSLFIIKQNIIISQQSLNPKQQQSIHTINAIFAYVAIGVVGINFIYVIMMNPQKKKK